MSPISMLFLKPIGTHRVINLLIKLERHLTTCKEGVKHTFPENLQQLRGTLFDKLDSCGITYTDQNKLFHRIANFDFELLCVEDEKFEDSETKTWIEKEIPISASKVSNSIQEPIFICDPNPRDLVSPFIIALVNLATPSKAQMKMNFFKLKRPKN